MIESVETVVETECCCETMTAGGLPDSNIDCSEVHADELFHIYCGVVEQHDRLNIRHLLSSPIGTVTNSADETVEP